MAKTVLLCTGKSCRKKAKVQAEILASLDDYVVIQPVRCQDICSGPVLGLEIGGRWEWFKKLRKTKDANAVTKSLRRDKISDSLKKLHVKKRSGKLRK